MSKALLRYIRLSPTKARLIAREVQGMNAELAIASLEFTPNKAAKLISKVIASAVANGGYDAQDVIVTSCRVDAGPVLRRFMPRAKGRATPIRKPTAHILVEVGTQKVQAKKVESKSKDSKVADSKNTEAKSAKKPAPKAKATQKAPAAKVESKEDKPKTAPKASAAKNTTAKKKTEGEEK
ncbi:50S ribosomal protein L22 [Helicobacter labetoulli]|nr:50S ribosomal protein L22 [Helicobacter labetoulli]